MPASVIPLTALSEAQRAQALSRLAIITALTLRQAIWRKDDPRWSACGIPSVFYTDHGSDFTSKHMEQVAADIGMELVFSEKGVPRGRGKVERFFRSVDQLFLQDVPGYAPKGYGEGEAALTLAAFEQRFRTWLLEDYHHRVHSETECQPKDRWERGGFVPRMPVSLEQLDLLLLTVAKTRRIQQDGIHFQNHRYMDMTLASFVKEEVVIRFDPADLGEIHVFYMRAPQLYSRVNHLPLLVGVQITQYRFLRILFLVSMPASG